MTNTFRFTCSVGGTTWAVLRLESSKAIRTGDSKQTPHWVSCPVSLVRIGIGMSSHDKKPGFDASSQFVQSWFLHKWVGITENWNESRGRSTQVARSSRAVWIFKLVRKDVESVIEEVFGHINRLRSECVQVQPVVTCWHPPPLPLLHLLAVYSINSCNKMIGNFPPAVLMNFNRLSLKLTRFICNQLPALPDHRV